MSDHRELQVVSHLPRVLGTKLRGCEELQVLLTDGAISLAPSLPFFSSPLKQNHVSQAGLKLLILLLHQPPKCQDCRCEQPHVTFPQIILDAVWWTSKVFLFFPW